MPSGKKKSSHHARVGNGPYRQKSSHSNSPKSCCQPMSYEESDALPDIPLSGRYSVKDLAWLLLRFQKFYTSARTSLQNLFSSLPTKLKSMKKGGRSSRVMEDLVLECFPILDDMLFFGLLQKSQITVRFFDDLEGNKPLGFQEERNNAKGFRQFIQIQRLRDMPPFLNIYFRSYTSTLVHEMIHAFFALYQCRASQKCIDANAIQEGDFGDEPGHGPAFRRVECWLGMHTLFVLGEIDLGVGRYIDPRVLSVDEPEECDCRDCLARLKWYEVGLPEVEDYDLKWETWNKRLDQETKKLGSIPTYPEGLSDGITYDFITGEGYVLSPPSASRQIKSETRNNIILELSPKQRSKFRDQKKKLRKLGNGEIKESKFDRRLRLMEGGKDKEVEPEKTKTLRKPRVAETSLLMDEMYGLQDY